MRYKSNKINGIIMPKKKKTAKHPSVKKPSLIQRWYKLGLGVVLLALTVSVVVAAAQTHSATTVQVEYPYPTPSDATVTRYGSIGKWMLKSNGEIANWGGKKHENKTLLEIVNVIIVDPISKSASDSVTKVKKSLSAAGFPSRFGHSNGFKGMIDGVIYTQQPKGLEAFSDKVFLVKNNHGRIFGPSLSTGVGYVWTGGFSTEAVTTFLGIPIGHKYSSFNGARDALAQGFVKSGQKKSDSVDLLNSYNTTVTTTGDHDGKAVVIVLQ